MTENNNINRMMELINYGRSENSTSLNNSSQGIVEYHAKAANGKTYGIIKEGKNFYIKVAPKKDTEVLAEDYDYIGGFMNKKDNEYSRYSDASKNFDLVLMSINESCGNKQPINKQFSTNTVQSEWQNEDTKEFRSEINRYKQISENVDNILDKGNSYISESTLPQEELPEAEKKHTDPKTASTPYNQKATANGDKEFKGSKTNPKTAGAPFDKKANVPSQMQSGKAPKGGSTEVYSKQIESKPKKSTGKVFKMTESQVLAWRHENDDYIDTSSSSEVGSSAPYTDVVDCATSNQCSTNNKKNNCNCGNCDCDEETYEIEVEVNEDIDLDDSNYFGSQTLNDDEDPNLDGFESQDMSSNINPDDVMGMPNNSEDIKNITKIRSDRAKDFSNDDDDSDDDANIDDIIAKYNIGSGVMSNNIGNDDESEDMGDDENIPVDNEPVDNEPVDNEPMNDDGLIDDNSLPIDPRRKQESVMHEFGNHPSYGKQPIKFHNNKEVSKNGRVIDDKSIANNKKFGTQKGKNDPFNNKAKNQPVEESILNVFGKHPGYAKQPMILPPNTEVAVNARSWDDESVKGSQPFGRSKGKKTVFTDETSNQPVEESTLNVFGKHPGYAKQPIVLPNNTNDDNDIWNDKSAKQSKKFGTSKGNSAPYSEELVNMITDSVMKKIQKKS